MQPIAPYERQRNNYQQQPSNASTNNIWQLYYVTEKILAAVLPQKNESLDNKLDYDNAGYAGTAARKQDDSEITLINMMEQKHGKVSGFYFFVFQLQVALVNNS